MLGLKVKYNGIATHVRLCLDLFESARTAIENDDLSRAKSIRSSDVTDVAGRFKMWSGNIAAHARGRRSLDYRLRDASHIRKRVEESLKELADLLQTAIDIVSGKHIPWDEELDTDDSDTFLGSEHLEDDSEHEDEDFLENETELQQIMVSLHEIIKGLLRLSMAIRNPAPHDQIAHAKDYNFSGREIYDINHVRDKFRNHIDESLCDRLGRAITNRRHYLKYRDEHHQRLAEGLDLDDSRTEGARTSTIASSIAPQFLDGAYNADADDDAASESGRSRTTFGTLFESNAVRLQPPSMPREAENGDLFECPICFVIISVSNTQAWWDHVYKDLRPYVCTIPDCAIPGQLFDSEHAWFEHEMQERAASHQAASEPHGVILSSRESVSTPSFQCSLCDQQLSNAKLLRKHIGKHQRELALFVLPSHLYNDVDENEQDDEVGATESNHGRADREHGTEDDCAGIDAIGKTEDEEKRSKGSHDRQEEEAEEEADTDYQDLLRIHKEKKDERERSNDHGDRTLPKLDPLAMTNGAGRMSMESAVISPTDTASVMSMDETGHRSTNVVSLEDPDSLPAAKALSGLGNSYEEFRRIQKENKEAEERKTKEEKEKIDTAMMERLIKAGYSYQTAEAMLNPDKEKKWNGYEEKDDNIVTTTDESSVQKAKDEEKRLRKLSTLNRAEYNNKSSSTMHQTQTTALGLEPSRVPVFPKIHKRYLDVETLQYYRIPYEHDRKDPNFFILLQEMEESETESLFEHTRRLRALLKPRKEKEEEATASSREDEDWQDEPNWLLDLGAATTGDVILARDPDIPADDAAAPEFSGKRLQLNTASIVSGRLIHGHTDTSLDRDYEEIAQAESLGSGPTASLSATAVMAEQVATMLQSKEIESSPSMISNQLMQNENNKMEDAKKNQDASNKTSSEIAGDKIQ